MERKEDMKATAVLFDLDGTLIDTLTDIADAMNGALRAFSLPEWPREDYRYLVGDGARKLAERAVRERADLTDAVRQAYQRRYEAGCMNASRPYPGMTEALRALSGAGFRLCVFSNKPDADTKRIIRHYFPEIAFDAVRGQREDVPVKPDPAGALATAAELGIDPGRFLYLGDTAVDMTCARRAGMVPVGALWGFRTPEELRESGAAFLLHEPGELIRLGEEMYS